MPSSQRTKPLRILHCACFHHRKYAGWYLSIDAKLSRGLTLNGHFVYDFSYRDVAKNEAFFPLKKLGIQKVNQRLLDCAEHLQPQVLLLGHSELIANATVKELRRRFPELKVAAWYCDPLWVPEKWQLLRAKRAIADAIFTTSGGSVLQELTSPNCRASHFPNPVDPTIESARSFEQDKWAYDLCFAGTEKGEPERTEVLRQILLDGAASLRTSIHKAFGQPAIVGQAYLQTFAQSMAGLNLSRRWDIPWYTSDRLAHIVGNGCVALSPRTPGLDDLLGPEGAAWFDTPDAALAQVHSLKAEPERAREIASRGWKRLHQIASAREVSAWMLEFLFEEKERPVCWQDQRAG
ncbi:MAG: glycosyltransferase [Opitutales bacterium]